MSERQPAKVSLSHTPLFLALLLIVTLIVLGVGSLLITGCNARTPSQTRAMAKANDSQTNPSSNPGSLQEPTAAESPESKEKPQYNLTPTIVGVAPTWPPDRDTPEPLPSPTEISYTPGPTAHFDVMVPFEEWTEYVNEGQGFTVKYPSDWYLNPGETGQTTQFFSYDFNDPALQLNPDLSLDYAKIEIGISGNWGPGQHFRENETLREWLYRTGHVGEVDQVLEEEEFLLDGLPAVRHLIDLAYGGVLEGVYVKRPTDVVIIGRLYREDFVVPNQIFDLMVQSFRNQQ